MHSGRNLEKSTNETSAAGFRRKQCILLTRCICFGFFKKFAAMVKLVLFRLIGLSIICTAYGDLGSAARWKPPYFPNACHFDTSQFPSNNMFAAAGEEIWDDGAACGRQYQVTCTGASAPAACIPGIITVTIVDRALALTSQPSKEGTLMVLSRTAFQAIATTSAASINIDFKQV